MNSLLPKPNLFIVGAPKTGTTALASYLGQHPNVFMTHPKEPHFFASDFSHHREIQTEQDYNHLFTGVSENHKAFGEASVWYLYSEQAIPSILRFNPDAQIVVMLRNPVDLVYSLHSQLLFSLYEDIEDFQSAWAAQTERRSGQRVPSTCPERQFLLYEDIGRLGDQLERAMGVVPDTNLHTILFDDLKADVSGVYQRCLEFLNLENDGRESFPVVNDNKQHRSVLAAKIIRDKHSRPAPWLARMDQILTHLPHGRRIRFAQRLLNANTVTMKRPPLSSAFRSRLTDIFSEDIRKLARLIQRDLTHWTQP